MSHLTDGEQIVLSFTVYNRETTSSSTAEIPRDADDVDFKFSEVTVHLTKKMPPNTIQIHPVAYYAKWYTDARLAEAVTPAHSVAMWTPPTNLATPTALSLWLAVLFQEHVLKPQDCVPALIALYIHTPPLFQVELEKHGWE